jgi:hypothetical protein
MAGQHLLEANCQRQGNGARNKWVEKDPEATIASLPNRKRRKATAADEN